MFDDCVLLSLMHLTPVVRNDEFIHRSSNSKAQDRIAKYVECRCAKPAPPAINALYNSPKGGLGLWSERVDYSVHGSSCALHSAVRDILGCAGSALRHVPRRADRPGLNTDSGNGEGEHD